MNNHFETALTLLNTLAEHGYPAQLVPSLDGWKILFPWYTDGDIACNSATGGYLESYGFPWDNGDVTVDTAEGFCHRLLPVWNKATY